MLLLLEEMLRTIILVNCFYSIVFGVKDLRLSDSLITKNWVISGRILNLYWCGYCMQSKAPSFGKHIFIRTD